MTIVSGGFGLPRRGSLVADGLTLSEPAAPTDDMTAALTGSGTITATLTDGNAAAPQPGGGAVTGRRRRHQKLPAQQFPPKRTPIPQPVPGWMAATLEGAGTLTAGASSFDWIAYEDDELITLLVMA